MSSFGRKNQLQLSLAPPGELLKVVISSMDSTLLLIHLNKGLCKRKVLHPGLPSCRKKISSDSFTFLISRMLFIVVWVNLVFYVFVCLKDTKTMCVYVYWYLCTLDGLWNKVSQLCISCSLDEYLHAQLSNVSFVYHLCDLYVLVDLSSFTSLSLFLTGRTKNPKRKA